MIDNKSNCCSPIQVGNFDRLSVGYDLKCGEVSGVLYEADNLECLPTVTVQTDLHGSENPCTAFIVFVVANERMIEKEIGKNNDPNSSIPGPVFTVGNVKKFFVRCEGSGSDGCAGGIGLAISYCGVNKCK